MADGSTTTYSFTLPEVGASSDTWGTKLNANWSLADDLLDGTTAISPKIAQLKESYAAVSSSAASLTVDCSTGTVFSLTLTESISSTTFSNPPASGTAYGMTIKVIQDAGASGYTITWPASVDWPSGTAPTLTATASAVDVFVFFTHDGGVTWYGFTAGQALA